MNTGDTSWMITAATLVGLMSIPGLAVLYGGFLKEKFHANIMLMVFGAFALTLLVWVLLAFRMGFGTPWIGTAVGLPGPANHLMRAAHIPLLGTFTFPQSALVYFQFAFAAITPILILGSVIDRIRLKAWLVFVPVWVVIVYAPDAFMLWGGGFWAQHGALDWAGGYVIHLSAGVAGFVAAAVLGRGNAGNRVNSVFLAVGAGLLWLGWNGFNGGSAYGASATASSAVLNTNLAAAAAMVVSMMLDRKPGFTGAVNGIITGLVAITPAAGYVGIYGAMGIGAGAAAAVWAAMTYLPRVWPFNRVDDTLGVVYTHGFAGLVGGLSVGLLAMHGELPAQLGAAATVIAWTAVATYAILRGIRLFTPLREAEHEEIAFTAQATLPRAQNGEATGRARVPAGRDRGDTR